MLLNLKVGAQVMLLANHRERGLFNGSRGVVERFDYHGIQDPPPTPIVSWISPGEYSKFARENLDEIAGERAGDSGHVPIPVVRFLTGNQLLCVIPEAWKFEIRLSNGCQLVLQRTQLPLALAWATTIHKSQGQTLDYVIADIEGCFQPGQFYVALSRCKEPDGLQIVGGDRRELQRACMAAPSVLKYYEDLERVEEGPVVRVFEQLGKMV